MSDALNFFSKRIICQSTSSKMLTLSWFFRSLLPFLNYFLTLSLFPRLKHDLTCHLYGLPKLRILLSGSIWTARLKSFSYRVLKLLTRLLLSLLKNQNYWLYVSWNWSTDLRSQAEVESLDVTFSDDPVWVRSIFYCSGWVSHLWLGFGFQKFPLKIPKIFPAD